MLMFGHMKIIFGNNKWLNYNAQVELFVVQNGRRMVNIFIDII